MASATKTDIWVYAHWQGMSAPQCIGMLSAHHAKGRKTFSFQYEPDWLQSGAQIMLDPDIGWFTGPQYLSGKENFGAFLDSMPDRWGQMLLKKRAAQQAKEAGHAPPTLYEIDFLLGVEDECRMGALRFKLDKNGPFLSNNSTMPIPPISSIRELQQAAATVESDDSDKMIKKWLAILLAPGSSLGGARPKANVRDENGSLWIAKFPSNYDTVDKGAWEFLTYKLAINAGIIMAPSKIMKVGDKHHTFLTNRFDRFKNERIHFASAMTMTGNNEESLKTRNGSFLELAEFIKFSGGNVKADLHQLWRRIVFNIAVSNTDCHLRNHGFLLSTKGWLLSPAYDLNPSIEKDSLALNIDMENNDLNFDLALGVGAYFSLSKNEMDQIRTEVNNSVKNWRQIASQIGILKKEQDAMYNAFKINILPK